MLYFDQRNSENVSVSPTGLLVCKWKRLRQYLHYQWTLKLDWHCSIGIPPLNLKPFSFMLSVFVVYLFECVSFQLKTPSCQPSLTTPTAPRFTSSSHPLMSCTWPAATSCRRLIGPTCHRLRGRTRSSPSSTRWWAWWRESSRLVTLPLKSFFFLLLWGL